MIRVKAQRILSVLTASAALAILAEGCTKDAVRLTDGTSEWAQGATVSPDDEDGALALSFSATAPSTKATPQTDRDALLENAIYNVDVFIFNSSNTFVKKVSATEAAPLSPATMTVKLAPGTYKIYAYANYPSDTRSDMSSWTTGYTSHPKAYVTLDEISVASSGFPMRCTATATVAKGTTSGASLSFNRVVSRARVVSITNNITPSVAVTFKGCFISNAVIVEPNDFDDYDEPDYYTNRWGTEDPSSYSYIDFKSYNPELFITAFIHPVSIASSGSWTVDGDSTVTASACYAMPNPQSSSPTDNGLVLPESWAGRQSWLVMVFTISGETVYYPYLLPAMTANRTYDLSVTLNHIGNDRPDVPFTSASYTASLDVADWSTGATYTETF